MTEEEDKEREVPQKPTAVLEGNKISQHELA